MATPTANQDTTQDKIAELQNAIKKGDPKVLGAIANFLQKSPSEVAQMTDEMLTLAWGDFSRDFWDFSKK